MSVMLTRVLLKVARMLAMPTRTFLAPLALMIFLPAKSSANNSAAVGAAATGAAPSAGLAPSAAAGAAPSAGAAAFLGAFSAFSPLSAFSAAGFAGFSAAPSGLPSFFGPDFFFSLAIF